MKYFAAILLLGMMILSNVHAQDLYINEFMAGNNAAVTDENGGFDDWIEIYNAGSQPVDIGGMYITDDLDEPGKYQIPAARPDSTTIPGGGFLVLWADKETNQGILHVDIKLSITGEQIGLARTVNTDTTYIDSLTFGEQTANISYGRRQDGVSEWDFFEVSSPGESNSNGTPVGICCKTSPLIGNYRLLQNYPNPFNPKTAVSYQLSAASKVDLSIYNLLGQKVTMLVSEKQSAGIYYAVWDASNFPSGIYICRLQAGNFVQTRKMIFMK
jgi:hypothetical protein